MSVRFAETPQSERSLQRTLSQGYGSGLRRWARQGFGVGLGRPPPAAAPAAASSKLRPPAGSTRPTVPCAPCVLQPEEQELQPRRPGHLWCRAGCETACPPSPKGLPPSSCRPPHTLPHASLPQPITPHVCLTPAMPPAMPWRRSVPWLLLLQEHHDCSSRMQAAVDDAVVSAEREAHAAGDRNLM